MSSPSLLNDVIDWFLGRHSDRRQYKRRPGTFHLWWLPAEGGDPRPGIGIELSPNGIAFVHHDRLPNGEHNLIVRVGEAKMPIRVKVLRSDQMQHQGKTWNRYLAEFSGISADNWDRVVRYVNGETEPEDRRKNQNQEMSRSDDAYRLLPLAVQHRIVAMLVERHRLASPPPGQAPLMKLFYGGISKNPDGQRIHRINVHSRIMVKDELTAYDTRFLVTDDGEVKLA